jgi:hypothetical protein
MTDVMGYDQFSLPGEILQPKSRSGDLTIFDVILEIEQ